MNSWLFVLAKNLIPRQSAIGQELLQEGGAK